MAVAKVKNKKTIQKRGNLFVISAPSGAGKTTLYQKLLRNISDMKLSVSYTTREPRKGEINDVDYTFITREKFKKMIDKGEFAEWATVPRDTTTTHRRINLKRCKLKRSCAQSETLVRRSSPRPTSKGRTPAKLSAILRSGTPPAEVLGCL